MKTVALVLSLALHLGALSVLPGSDDRGNSGGADAANAAQAYAASCKCDLEMSADCAEILESR